VQHRLERDLARNLRQRFAAHQALLQAVQLAFAQRRVAHVDLLGHHAVEHRVAEEFEPFVAFEPLALVAQGLIEQFAPPEAVAEPLLEIRFPVYWPPREFAA
jgi:hypothetical protein